MRQFTSTLQIAAIIGLTGVAIGAFGAHWLPALLKELTSTEREYRLGVLATGAQYQMYHALALLVLGTLQRHDERPGRWQGPAVSLTFGILLFSGSLYGIAFSGTRQLGMMTPFGGLAFLLGWSWIAITARTHST